jgi:hypothetical protein
VILSILQGQYYGYFYKNAYNAQHKLANDWQQAINIACPYISAHLPATATNNKANFIRRFLARHI